MAIVIRRILDGFHICFPDACNIAQRDCGLGSGNVYQNITDLLNRAETAQCLQDDFHTVNIYPAGGTDDVLLL